MANSLKILSVNCRGLNNKNKRLSVFQYVHNLKYDIYCIQDTHFTPDMYQNIYSEWGSEIYLSYNSSKSRGVAILFSKLNFKIYESIIDDENGNFVILDLSVNDFRFTLTSIYGPTDQPQFYNNIFEKIDRIGNASYMICGDFKLVIDPKKDYFNYKHINNKKSRDTLLNHISIRDLTDPFRQFNPDKQCYTWRKRNPIQQARLDFFLISPPLNTFMISSSIEIGFMFDHSIISTNLQINEFQYSSGLWKHNNALLTELDYINTINTKIEEIKKQYALPAYDRNHLKEIPNSEIQCTINDQLFLETLLMEI